MAVQSSTTFHLKFKPSFPEALTVNIGPCQRSLPKNEEKTINLTTPSSLISSIELICRKKIATFCIQNEPSKLQIKAINPLNDELGVACLSEDAQEPSSFTKSFIHPHDDTSIHLEVTLKPPFIKDGIKTVIIAINSKLLPKEAIPKSLYANCTLSMHPEALENITTSTTILAKDEQLSLFAVAFLRQGYILAFPGQPSQEHLFKHNPLFTLAGKKCSAWSQEDLSGSASKKLPNVGRSGHARLIDAAKELFQNITDSDTVGFTLSIGSDPKDLKISSWNSNVNIRDETLSRVPPQGIQKFISSSIGKYIA